MRGPFRVSEFTENRDQQSETFAVYRCARAEEPSRFAAFGEWVPPFGRGG
jgi:hypothetical protein